MTKLAVDDYCHLKQEFTIIFRIIDTIQKDWYYIKSLRSGIEYTYHKNDLIKVEFND